MPVFLAVLPWEHVFVNFKSHPNDIVGKYNERWWDITTTMFMQMCDLGVRNDVSILSSNTQI